MNKNRRAFLGRSLATGGGLLWACSDDQGSTAAEPTPTDAGQSDPRLLDSGVGAVDAGVADAGRVCGDPFERGTLIGRAGFLGEDRVPLNRLFNQGWDGRLYTDLSNLDEDNLIISNELFYVRTRYPDLLNPPPVWTIEVNGLAVPTTLTLDALLPLVRPMGTHVLECSGNGPGGAFGLLSAATWAGIPLDEVLDRIEIDPAATRVLVSGFDEHSVPSVGGHSTPGAAWIFTFEQLRSAGAFLATEMNGEPLPPDHGAPVRLYVPNWYGCTCIKWVNEIELLDDSALATSQMTEFASRTHQTAQHPFARDYTPATMDQAAMPIRVEQWRVDGDLLYRIVGIMWGGYEPTDALAIRFNGGPAQPVDVCPPHAMNATWTLWSHAWRPPAAGDYAITMSVEDPNIPTIRLDSDFYERTVRITEV